MYFDHNLVSLQSVGLHPDWDLHCSPHVNLLDLQHLLLPGNAWEKWKFSSKKNFNFFPFAVYHEVLGPNPSSQLSTEQVWSSFLLIQPLCSVDNPISFMFKMINDQSGQVAVLQHRGWWGGGGGERSNNEGDGLHCLWYCPLSGLIYLTTTWCCDYHLCVYKFFFTHYHIVRFLETLWATPPPHLSPLHLRWRRSQYPGFIIIISISSL